MKAVRIAVILTPLILAMLLLAGAGHAAAGDPGDLAAAFSVSPAEGPEPLTVEFTDSTVSHDGIVSWLWDFGDGQISTEQHPVHVYTQDGTYTVALTVEDGEGGSDNETRPDCINVADTAPQAQFLAAPLSGPEPLTVEFTDSTVSHDGIVSWLWDFGDGQTGSEQHPIYQYVDEGTYTVSLTVMDADGDTDSDVRAEYITVQPLPRAAFCASSTSVGLGDEVSFQDLSTGDIASWLWDFDDDDVVDSTERNPAYLYDAAGTYNVSLTVIGGGGSDVETKEDYISVSGIDGAEAAPGAIVPTRVTVEAGGPCTVQTEDGRVTVEFTEGALEEDGRVTIKGEPAVDFSACPSGYRPGATCFSVESTAALAPGAAMTITVVVCGGDVEDCDSLDRLKLAWYDPVAGEWDLLPTSADPEANTIAVAAARFGRWMVLVNDPPGFPLQVAACAVAGFLGLLLVGAFFIRARRRQTG